MKHEQYVLIETQLQPRLVAMKREQYVLVDSYNPGWWPGIGHEA